MFEPSFYKALLFDVDKTLTVSIQDVTEETKHSLRRASEKYLLGVCTGRNIISLREKIFPLFPQNSLHIVAGGSQIVEGSGSVVWSNCIPKNKADELTAEFERLHVSFIWQCNDAIYGNDQMRNMGDGSDRSASYRNWLLSIRPYEKCLAREIPIITVSTVTPDLLQFLSTRQDIVWKKMTSSVGLPYIDITNSGVTKATALKRYCDLLKISMNEVVGFGDSENDIEFLQAVGYAVAMGNAVDGVKKIADEIILSCEENGVAKFITDNLEGRYAS